MILDNKLLENTDTTIPKCLELNQSQGYFNECIRMYEFKILCFVAKPENFTRLLKKVFYPLKLIWAKFVVPFFEKVVVVVV